MDVGVDVGAAAGTGSTWRDDCSAGLVISSSPISKTGVFFGSFMRPSTRYATVTPPATSGVSTTMGIRYF